MDHLKVAVNSHGGLRLLLARDAQRWAGTFRSDLGVTLSKARRSRMWAPVPPATLDNFARTVELGVLAHSLDYSPAQQEHQQSRRIISPSPENTDAVRAPRRDW